MNPPLTETTELAPMYPKRPQQLRLWQKYGCPDFLTPNLIPIRTT